MNANHKRLDQEFELFILDIINDVDTSEFTPEKREERKKRAKNDFEFCKIYYPKTFTLPFNNVHKHISALKQGNYTISGFPTSGKTAFTFVTKVIKPILEDLDGIINISLRTQEIAKERTAHIFRLITLNRLLMYDYAPKIHQEKKGYYRINKATLIATSVEIGLRNFVDDNFKRFKISILDDLFNRKTVTSEKDNASVKDFITGEAYRQMEPKKGLSILLFNWISDDCPGAQVAEEFPANHFSFPVKDAKTGKSNWEAKYPTAELPQLEADTAVDVWNGEYIESPLLIGDIFDPVWLKFVNINFLNIVAAISVADPAFGKSPQSCAKGLATLGITDKKETVMIDIYIRHEPYGLFFDYLYNISQDVEHWKSIYFEDDFAQWTIAKKFYETWLESNEGKRIPIIPFKSKELKTWRGSDKQSRILNLVEPHQSGKFYYNLLIKNSRDYKTYQSQYLSFGSSNKKLDGIDATASAYLKIFNYLKIGGDKFDPAPGKPRLFNNFINMFR